MTGCQESTKSESSTVSTSTGGSVIMTKEIPEDGIVTKSVFEELKESGNTYIYKSYGEDFQYQWTFVGADITNPVDFDIRLSFTGEHQDLAQSSTNANRIQGFTFADNEPPGKWSLKIQFADKWDSESIILYNYDGEEEALAKVGTVKMDNSTGKTSVTFGLSEAKGEFYLGSSEEAENPDELLATNEDGKQISAEWTEEQKEAKIAEQKALKQKLIDTENSNTEGKDKYLTGPVPAGKPQPKEWQNVTIDKNTTLYCSLTIRCDTIWWPEYYPLLNKNKEPLQPKDGVIYSARKVAYHPGESVFDVLHREMKNNGIHMEFEMTPIYNSNYIEGINNLYEFDCGELSGWMYAVNSWYPNYGCSRYQVEEGDIIELNYTCDLGRDLGQTWLMGN